MYIFIHKRCQSSLANDISETFSYSNGFDATLVLSGETTGHVLLLDRFPKRDTPETRQSRDNEPCRNLPCAGGCLRSIPVPELEIRCVRRNCLISSSTTRVKGRRFSYRSSFRSALVIILQGGGNLIVFFAYKYRRKPFCAADNLFPVDSKLLVRDLVAYTVVGTISIFVYRQMCRYNGRGPILNYSLTSTTVLDFEIKR
jgi:hypothetical protein